MMLTLAHLKEVLHYDRESGVFTRLRVEGVLNQYLIGKPAGRLNTKGHRQIGIDGRKYLAHRLAWFYETDNWPRDKLDHRNLIKDDNRFKNLREATNSENLCNTGVPKTNTTGFKGVTFVPKLNKFKAQIRLKGVYYYLGVYSRASDAAAAYAKASNDLHGEFGRLAA